MRLLGLTLLALAAIWFGFVDNDWLDRRPVQRILFLGHSLTYYNDMPTMVAKMSDSSDSPVRLDMTMSAFPNAGPEDHWNNRNTRRLLSDGGWDRVILQPRRHYDLKEPESSLYVYGSKLLAGTGKQPPVVVISHLTSQEDYQRNENQTTRFDDFRIHQENIRGLAAATGADVIDVASIWDQVMAQDLPFSLYKDGNHPSLQGSYLIGLVVYANLTRSDVTKVTYVPWGMSGDDAELLRNKVQLAIYGL